jgi:hypothetical protein
MMAKGINIQPKASVGLDGIGFESTSAEQILTNNTPPMATTGRNFSKLLFILFLLFI